MENGKIKIAVIGGDERFTRAAALLRGEGFEVAAHKVGGREGVGLEDALSDVSAVLLPVPCSRDGVTVSGCGVKLDEIFRLTPSDAVVFTGGPCGKTQKKTVDYANSDAFAYLNAVPTAEGAIALAVTNTPFTLAGADCLVIGAGRCGRILAERLAALKARVTVSARRESDLAYARALGFEVRNTNDAPQNGERYDVIFNTVPAPVVTEALLETVTEEGLVIDLASGRQTDEALCAAHGVKLLFAPGLPGKTAPAAAARIIADAVIHEINGKGHTKYGNE